MWAADTHWVANLEKKYGFFLGFPKFSGKLRGLIL